MGKSLTQFDVAKAAGVSRSTVAAVLQSRPSTSIISKDKKERVLKAAEKLNYRPHFAARSLRMGKTRSIAFAVPSATSFGGTVTSQILIGIMGRARELGYSLTVSAYELDDGPEASFEDLIRSSQFDGFFHFGGVHPEGDRKAKICAQWHKPYVVLQQPAPGATSIYFDDVLGGKLAMDALVRAGCEHVAIVSDHRSTFYVQRLRGALSQAEEAGIETITMPLEAGDLAESGRQAVQTLWTQGRQVDGIYGATDQTAMAAIQKLRKWGASIPKDVAVVGHDDGPMAALASPALTSVRQDGREMGRQAMDMLHERIEAKNEIPVAEHKMQPVLIERESTNRKAKETKGIDTEAKQELVCV